MADRDKLLDEIEEEIRSDLELQRFSREIQREGMVDLLERLSEMLAEHSRQRRCGLPEGTLDEPFLRARAIVLYLRNRAAAGKIIDLEKLPPGPTVVQ